MMLWIRGLTPCLEVDGVAYPIKTVKVMANNDDGA